MSKHSTLWNVTKPLVKVAEVLVKKVYPPVAVATTLVDIYKAGKWVSERDWTPEPSNPRPPVYDPTRPSRPNQPF